MSSQSSSDSSVVPPKLMETTITYQFVAAFYIDRNLIEIPSFYYRKDHSKYFFTDGLKQLRKEFNIQEGITITYAATDRDWIFNLHFMSPLDYQTYGGLPANRRTHVDVLAMDALTYVGASTQNMTILANHSHFLVWKLTVHYPKTGQQCVADPCPTTIDDDVDSEHDCNEHTTYDYENTGIDLEIPTYFFLSFHFCWTCGPSKLANSSLGATYNDIGDPGWKIIHCKAIMWYDERIMLWLWQNTTSSTRRSSTANETTTF
ncbi:hypothetical protein JHK87_055030 [Glycine soja]|nr:hypothetical protein JHK87_055030 [Glycine soja]